MPSFYGTNASETIADDFVSATVVIIGLPPLTSNAIDFVYGSGGYDYILTGAGNDTAYGDAGDDTIDDLGIFSVGGNDKFYGGDGFDYINGRDGNDYLDGGADYDYLNGGSGNDTLVGGTSNDEMNGGTGNDIYYVDNIYDHAYEYAGEGYDTIYTSVSYNIDADSPNSQVTYVEEVILTGAANAELIGNAEANILRGNGGNNKLEGRGGFDRLFGGGGNDTVFAGEASDDVYGQDGNDIVRGGLGSDNLFGGKGNDKFQFINITTQAFTEVDVIKADGGVAAFEKPGALLGDLIDLALVDADFTIAGNQAFKFNGTGKGFIKVRESAGNTEIVGNVDNDVQFEIKILIADGAVAASAYTAADFIL